MVSYSGQTPELEVGGELSSCGIRSVVEEEGKRVSCVVPKGNWRIKDVQRGGRGRGAGQEVELDCPIGVSILQPERDVLDDLRNGESGGRENEGLDHYADPAFLEREAIYT